MSPSSSGSSFYEVPVKLLELTPYHQLLFPGGPKPHAVRLHPVVEERLVALLKLEPSLVCPNPELIVLPPVDHVLVVSAEVLPYLPLIHGCPVDERSTLEPVLRELRPVVRVASTVKARGVAV
jgi:hypothetical protein